MGRKLPSLKGRARLWQGRRRAPASIVDDIRGRIHDEIPRYAQSVTGALWRIDRDKVNRGQVLKIIGSDIHKQLTVRNPNTVRKLYALMRADTISP
jgi:hypothetical protein